MKKSWINGLEYYIDEFCVNYALQGKGIGSRFIAGIEAELHKEGLEGMILNTERGCPAFDFYKKNGFKELGLTVMGK